MSKRIAIVGGGISGLVTGYWLRRLRPEWTVEVYERESTPGGKVRTTTRDGYTVEWGPNGFLTSVADTLELAVSLGLGEALLPAADASKRRYLFRDGGLRALPTTPPAFLGTELLSVAGKIRAALEPALVSRRSDDESVFAFVERHFGREAADALAEPLVLGITGGDPHELSLDALFPRLREIEHEHRSLILGMVRGQRANRREPVRTRGTLAQTASDSAASSTAASTADAGALQTGVPPSVAAKTGGRLTTFANGGTQRLIDALAASLGDAVVCDTAVAALEPAAGRRVRLHVERRNPLQNDSALSLGHAAPATASTSESIDVDIVVLAAPAFAAATMLADWQPDAAHLLSQIPFAPIDVLGLGFDRMDVPRVLDGFGFLAPSGEGLRSLGVLWSSSMFPGQAPAGKVLLRVLAGGRRDPGFADLDQADVVGAALQDLARSMGVAAEPEFVETVRWRRAIPQYTMGHGARLDRAEQILGSAAGSVFLTGNSYRGVGLNDCVKDAKRVAGAISDRMETDADTAG